MIKRILHVSDWHAGSLEAQNAVDRIVQPGNTERIRQQSTPDIILLTGDMVCNTYNHGHRDLEAEDQLQIWGDIVDVFLARWPKARLVGVPGNHEYFNYGDNEEVTSIDERGWPKTFKVAGVKFTGFRGVPFWRGDWDTELQEVHIAEVCCRDLDPTAHVLLTHTPPSCILDMTRRGVAAGSTALREWVDANPVQLHAFGHIHEARGVVDRKKMAFSNAAMGWNWLTVEV